MLRASLSSLSSLESESFLLPTVLPTFHPCRSLTQDRNRAYSSAGCLMGKNECQLLHNVVVIHEKECGLWCLINDGATGTHRELDVFVFDQVEVSGVSQTIVSRWSGLVRCSYREKVIERYRKECLMIIYGAVLDIAVQRYGKLHGVALSIGLAVGAQSEKVSVKFNVQGLYYCTSASLGIITAYSEMITGALLEEWIVTQTW
jgi:hypothetical protein